MWKCPQNNIYTMCNCSSLRVSQIEVGPRANGVANPSTYPASTLPYKGLKSDMRNSNFWVYQIFAPIPPLTLMCNYEIYLSHHFSHTFYTSPSASEAVSQSKGVTPFALCPWIQGFYQPPELWQLRKWISQPSWIGKLISHFLPPMLIFPAQHACNVVSKGTIPVLTSSRYQDFYHSSTAVTPRPPDKPQLLRGSP